MEDPVVMEDNAAPAPHSAAITTPDGPDAVPLIPESRLSAAIEAILLTHDRPVGALKIAEALGLIPPAPDEPTEPASDDGPEPAGRKKQRKPKAPHGDRGGGAARVEAAVRTLNEEYARTARAFRIESVAGGYRVMTLPEFAPILANFQKSRSTGKLSRAAVETLAIIAYKQPLTRAHLEAIRGVACGEVLRSLMERRLVTIKGRAEELGRPILYGTTKEFLDAFGLASLKDLPSASELQSQG